MIDWFERAQDGAFLSPSAEPKHNALVCSYEHAPMPMASRNQCDACFGEDMTGERWWCPICDGCCGC